MPTVKHPRLSKLQYWMRWTLTHPQGAGAALKKPHPLKPYARLIEETPEVSREERLSIYGDGYFGRIIEVLGANYSSVKNVVGSHPFEHLARAYLVKYPSRFKSIDDVGADLAVFLKRSPLTKKLPFLPELALLEWSAHQSFFANDLPLLNPKELNGISEKKWGKAVMTLDPSVRIHKVNWPVDELWRLDGKWDKRRKFKKEKRLVLVFRRPDKLVRMRSLSVAQFELLDHLKKGRMLGQALQLLSRRHLISDGTFVQKWFSDWINEGVIKKIQF